jgi:hypothetical protein
VLEHRADVADVDGDGDGACAFLGAPPADLHDVLPGEGGGLKVAEGLLEAGGGVLLASLGSLAHLGHVLHVEVHEVADGLDGLGLLGT